jgi:CO dehydrogenase nickel-insertion accessory protein CooC1
VLLANALVESGYEVCVLDADSTNSGLAKVLGVDPPVSLLEWFGGTIFGGGKVTCPVDDPGPLKEARVRLDQLPAKHVARSPQGVVLVSAGKIGPLGPGAACDGPMTKIARDFSLELPGTKPVTLVDCKAGLEDVARGVITNLDFAVVVVDPTRVAIQVAIDLKETIDLIKGGALPATQHLDDPQLVELANQSFREARIQGMGAILSKVENDKTKEFLGRSLAKGGVKVIGVVRRDEFISAAWLYGLPLTAAEEKHEVIRIVRRLERVEAREALVGVTSSNDRAAVSDEV